MSQDTAAFLAAVAAADTPPPNPGRGPLDQDASEQIRLLLTRELAGGLPDLGVAEQDRLHARTAKALGTLVAAEGVRIRAAIAGIVKDLANAPRDLILQLANDTELSVSEPVIRLSPLLTSEDLMALLEPNRSASAATSVARRPGLQEMLCDEIAATADRGAIKALLENKSAAIRECTLDSLIARAAAHTEWHEPLVRRPHLTASAASALSLIVATQLLQVLADRTDLPQQTIRFLRRQLESSLHGPSAPPPRASLTLEQAVAEARVMREENVLTEAALLAALHNGEDRMAAAMLAVAADMPPVVVQRAMVLRSSKALVSLAWKAGFTMRAATALQGGLSRMPFGNFIRPGVNGSCPLAPDEMRWQLDAIASAGR